MDRFKKFFGDWFKAFAVCYPMMVEGNLSALTMSHFWTANFTGLTTACLALVLSLRFKDLSFQKFKWYDPALLGISAFFADILSHASHFWGFLGEAFLTGIGTFALALFFKYWKLESR